MTEDSIPNLIEYITVLWEKRKRKHELSLDTTYLFTNIENLARATANNYAVLNSNEYKAVSSNYTTLCRIYYEEVKDDNISTEDYIELICKLFSPESDLGLIATVVGIKPVYLYCLRNLFKSALVYILSQYSLDDALGKTRWLVKQFDIKFHVNPIEL